MAGQVNAVARTGDTPKVSTIVNTNSMDYLPKNAIAKARLLSLFDVNGNRIVDENEKEGLKLVLESGGREQWDIRDENGRWIGYIMDGSEIDADPSDTYEYAALNENEQRDYYARVNIYTGEETFIKYHYDENGDWEERYHNKALEGRVEAEYTGPNNNLPKKITEVKAIYKQSNEFLLDENGEIIIDDETGEPKRAEELVGYETTVWEYKYDKNFNLIGEPKPQTTITPVQNKPKKGLNIKG